MGSCWPSGSAGLSRLTNGSVCTGLRASELASLTPASFQLAGRAPCVVVRGAYTKNREPANQPIGKDLAKRLRGWLSGRTGALWPGKWWRRAAEMLAVDLKAANIEYETEAGTCDFHALRVCYITSLARGGVHPAIAQKLARHSTVNLTLNVYTKLSEAEIQEGLPGAPAIACGEGRSAHQMRTKKMKLGCHRCQFGYTGGTEKG